MKPASSAGAQPKIHSSARTQTSCAEIFDKRHGKAPERHVPEGFSRGLPLQETLFALDGGQCAVGRSMARVLIVLPVPSEMVLGPPWLLPSPQTPYK